MQKNILGGGSNTTIRTAELSVVNSPLDTDYLTTSDNKSFIVRTNMICQCSLVIILTALSNSNPHCAIKVNNNIVVEGDGSNAANSRTVILDDVTLSSGDVITCGNTTSGGRPATGLIIKIIKTF